MLIISSRFEFWDSNDLSNSDKVRDVDLDTDDLGNDLDEQEFSRRVRGKRILLLIHGYNNEEDDVVRAYSIIEGKVSSLLSRQYDMTLGYTWPGGDDRFDYYAAKTRASSVAPRLRRWLRVISRQGQSIDVMAHSMGCRVGLLALRERTPRVNNMFTMAAAVDNESIQVHEKYYPSSKACKSLYVFHSKNDPVLEGAYLMAEWDNALGYSGPEDPAEIVNHSPNVKVVNCKRAIKSHGGYKDSDQVYGFIKKQLTSRRKQPQYSTL